MALNELIAQGAQFKTPDMMGQYSNALAIQNGMQTNQMNQIKMDDLRRANDEQNQLRALYKGVTDLQDPTLAGRVAGINPAAGWAVTKAQQDAIKVRADASKTGADAVGTALNNSKRMLDGITTPEQYMQWHLANYSDPVLGPWLKERGSTPEQSFKIIQDALSKPDGFEQLLKASTLGSEKALKNHFAQFDTGQQIGTNVMPEYGTGPAQVVQGTVMNKQATPGQLLVNQVASRNADTNEAKLRLAERTAETKVSKVDTAKADGQKALDDIVSALGQQYEILDKNNGITSTQNKAGTNIGAYLESSPLGQMAGRALGTENQSARNQISMTRPHLLMAVKNATGMTAKQLDSNADLKLWLTAATDPTLDIQANRAALDNILKFAAGHSAPIAATPAVAATSATAGEVNQALAWARKNPNDPDAKRIIREFGGK